MTYTEVIMGRRKLRFNVMRNYERNLGKSLIVNIPIAIMPQQQMTDSSASTNTVSTVPTNSPSINSDNNHDLQLSVCIPVHKLLLVFSIAKL